MSCDRCFDLDQEVRELRDQVAGLERLLTAKIGENTKLRNELEEAKGAGAREWEPLVRVLFDYWRERCDHPRAKLDKKRARAIAGRLRDGYSPDDIRQAVDGAAKFPFVVNGGRSSSGRANERFDDVELICRNAANLERFGRLGVGTVERNVDRSKLVGA